MKINMRKLSVIVLLLLLVFTLSACGQTAQEQPPVTEDQSSDTFVAQVLGEKPAAAEKLTIAAIQFAFKTGDVDSNLEEAERLIDEAASGGAQIIVLPELWSVGYDVEDLNEYAETQADGKTINFMKEKAKEHQLYICGGYVEKNENSNLPYNSAALIDPNGEIILNHQKVQLYTPLGEDKVHSAGDRFDVVDTPLGRIGIVICYDGDFPEPWRILAANKNADIILQPTAYESPCEDIGWWDKLYEASAMHNAVWLVSANMAGASSGGDCNFFGGSRIIDPMGNTVAEATYVKPGEKAASELLIMELDFAKGLEDGDYSNGSLVTDRRVDVYHNNGL